MDKKTSLRLKAKEIRNNSDITRISNFIVNNISDSNIFKSADNIMIFYPLEKEINVLELTDFKEKNFFLPRTADKYIECCPYKKDDFLRKGKFNIFEPICESVSPEILDLIIVPALAVDKNGNRLGYGGGFYDRFLSSIDNNKCKTLVPIQQCLIMNNIPSEKFDIKINFAVTEKEFVII